MRFTTMNKKKLLSGHGRKLSCDLQINVLKIMQMITVHGEFVNDRMMIE
jgi:hypothetical protein